MSNVPPPPPGAPPPPPPSSAASTAGVGSPAGFGARLGAYIIDALVVGVPAGILVFIGIAMAPTEIVVCDDGFGLCEQPTGTGWAIIVLFYLAGVVGAFAYYAVLEGGTGQTVGKKALNIKRIDAVTGQPIGGGRAVGLMFARVVSGLPCYLGYLWMLWDQDQQTWHDKMLTSRVITSA